MTIFGEHQRVFWSSAFIISMLVRNMLNIACTLVPDIPFFPTCNWKFGHFYSCDSALKGPSISGFKWTAKRERDNSAWGKVSSKFSFASLKASWNKEITFGKLDTGGKFCQLCCKKKNLPHHIMYLKTVEEYFIKWSIPSNVILGTHVMPDEMLLVSISLALKITAPKL